MAWDEAAAKESVATFDRQFADLKQRHPEAMAQLQSLWQEYFPKCGHKRLGRILLGKSVEEACRTRGGDKE